MAIASFLDVCRFNPVSNGTGSFVVSSAVGGYQTPASAGAVTGATYRYRAESADLTQWEVGYGVYTVSTTTLTRATILFNSSGGTTAISFTAVPQVAIVALAEDLLPLSSPLVLDVRNFAVSPLTFSTVGTGSDDTATIQAAVNAANTAGGGTIAFPALTFHVSSPGIDFTNKANIVLQGQGGGESFNAVTAIVYTSASGSLIKMDGSSGCIIERMQLQYSSATYSGDLVNLVQVSGTSNTDLISIHDCIWFGTSGTAASFLRLGNNGVIGNGTLSIRIERCIFEGAVQCIKGGAASNNIYIANNFFNENSGSPTSHIGVQGESWTLINNSFEPVTGTVSNNITANGVTTGLLISGNTFNDGATGTPISLTGGVVSGLSITGNDIQGGSFSINVGSAIGVSITGNACLANNVQNIIISAATSVFCAGNTGPGSLVSPMPTAGVNIVDDNTGTGLYINKTQGVIRLTADLAITSNTSFTNVGSLTMNVTAGASYLVEGYLSCTCAAAGGVKVAFFSNATNSSFILDSYIVDTNTIKSQTNVTAPGTLVSSTTTGTSGIVVRIAGAFTVTVSGAIIIQFAQNASNTTASVLKQGSWLKITPAA